MLEVISYIFILFLSYLIGSLPFSFIIAYSYFNKNLLLDGTGNVGAKNLWKVTGSNFAGITGLFLDLAKGIIAYTFTYLILNLLLELNASFFELNLNYLSYYAVSLIAVIMGHNKSLFLSFRGGKGLSTAAGFLVCVQPWIIPLWIFWSFICYFIALLIKVTHKKRNNKTQIKKYTISKLRIRITVASFFPLVFLLFQYTYFGNMDYNSLMLVLITCLFILLHYMLYPLKVNHQQSNLTKEMSL